MTTTETVFNIPCREGSLDVIVKGDSSFAGITQDSPLQLSPPKVFIHCTCGALHSPADDVDGEPAEIALAVETSNIDSNSYFPTKTYVDDYSFQPNLKPQSTSSPIKPASLSVKKKSPELHYHEHYHYVDDDDYEGYTSDLNEHVAKYGGNEKQRNKLLSKTGVSHISSPRASNGVKVSFVSVKMLLRYIIFWSLARNSISRFVGQSVGRSVGWLVGPFVGRLLFTKHATYGDRPC